MALLPDVRHSLRLIASNPGFAGLTVLALALGIGANTALFSVVEAVLLRPLPYTEPERLVVALHEGTRPVAPANYLDWRAGMGSFEETAAAQAWGPSLTGPDRSEPVRGLQVSANLFRLLGVSALRGRTLVEGDDEPGAERVVVVGHALWQRRFGGDPTLVGRRLALNGESHTVVGIMPLGFQFAPFWVTDAEVWAPMALGARTNDRSGQSLRVFARLRLGATVERAQAEMDSLWRGLQERYPEENRGVDVRIVPLKEKVVGDVRPTLLALLGTVGFVLLIACANVANLALARAAGRAQELAVRTALGAGRGRLARQLLTESVVLALLGGAAGLLLALWGVSALSAALPPGSLPRAQELGLNRTALAFTLGLSVLTGVLAGLAPAWQASGLGVGVLLRNGGRGSTGGRGRHRTRSLLVAVETALALALLVGAGLMVRSFLHLRALDPGFEPEGLLSMTVSVTGTSRAPASQRTAFYDDVARRLSGLPGVRAVSAINHLPLGGDTWGQRVAIEGRPVVAPDQRIGATYRVVRTGYFGTMGIPIRRGREFTEADREGAPGVVAVNEAMARRHWPGQDPVGQRLTLDDPRTSPEWRTVVAVVANVRQAEWAAEPGEEVYLPYLQSESYRERPEGHYGYLTFVLRTAGDPERLATAAREAVWSIDRSVPVSEPASLRAVIGRVLWRERLSLQLLGGFGALALLLAATGIYSVVSHSVAQRRQEIGIRMALGARPRDVLGLALREGMVPVLGGMAVGCVLAVATTRLLASLLHGVAATDPVTLGAVVVGLGTVAVGAHVVPVRRVVRGAEMGVRS